MTAEGHLNNIAKAIFTINKHAKTAPEPQHLYAIKKATIEQLLKENKAGKVGLHFSNNPRNSNQHSTTLISVADYFFHIPPSKQDFKELKHLGSLDENFRNPRTHMSLSVAKKMIYEYINWQEPKPNKTIRRSNQHQSTYYTASSLGKMEWPPTKRF